jgi:lipoate-protein ligase A
VVGYAHFKPVTLDPPPGGAPWAGLAPLAVLPEYQCLGIGSWLVIRGLDRLRTAGVPASVKVSCEPPADGELACGPAGVCFQRAELYDIINETTGQKIAGAAQKRNKHGLLFQGSLWRPAVAPITVDWDSLAATFATTLATMLEAEAVEKPWPDFNEDEFSALVEHYGSTEWIEHR